MSLRKVVKRAESEANKLSLYLQDIERHLVFIGFNEDELRLTAGMPTAFRRGMKALFLLVFNVS